ncbi:NAD(P)-binding Rossmann-fold superfamily protein [Trifolium repens]|nr:NAD(P)-binding Rossmann-fold superfamily protein [Trifolium repens]
MLLHLNLTRFSVFSLTDKSLLFCFSPPVAVLLPRFRLPPTSAKYKSPSPSFCFRFGFRFRFGFLIWVRDFLFRFGFLIWVFVSGYHGVTGASGYIASWIVKFLLQRGYTVRATIRDLSNPNKVDHLLKLDGAKERLQFFKADLLEEGSFDSVIQGCS